jgi:hypothetical protein
MEVGKKPVQQESNNCEYDIERKNKKTSIVSVKNNGKQINSFLINFH